MSYLQIWQASSHIWAISSIDTRGQQYVTEIKCIGKPTWLTKLIYYINCYFFKNKGPKQVFGQNGINIIWNNNQNVKLVKQLMTGIKSF